MANALYALFQIAVVLGGAILLAILVAFPFIVIGRLGRIVKLLEQLNKK